MVCTLPPFLSSIHKVGAAVGQRKVGAFSLRCRDQKRWQTTVEGRPHALSLQATERLPLSSMNLNVQSLCDGAPTKKRGEGSSNPFWSRCRLLGNEYPSLFCSGWSYNRIQNSGAKTGATGSLLTDDSPSDLGFRFPPIAFGVMCLHLGRWGLSGQDPALSCEK